MADKIGRNFGKLSGKEHYQVKYPSGRNSFTYGIARMYGDSKNFNKNAAVGKIVIDHAIFPIAGTVEESLLVDLKAAVGGCYPDELGYFWGKGEYEDYVVLQQIVHDIIDYGCGDRVEVGKTFSCGVGDGFAYYVITSVARVNCSVEWRGFCADRYVDRMFGYGGSFRKSDITRFCGKGIRFDEAEESKTAARRLESLRKYVEDFRTRYGFLPSDIETSVSRIQ